MANLKLLPQIKAPAGYESWSKSRQRQFEYAKHRELNRIIGSIKSDEQYRKEITDLYRKLERDTRKEINAWLGKYALQEQITIAEARRRISTHDVKEFSERVAEYVKERELSERAQRELALYNVTMRMNREEFLAANIRLETISTADKEERMLRERLINIGLAETTRQAGILAMTVRKNKSLRAGVESAVEWSTNGATFSDRIWTNQRDMQDAIERGLRRSILRGQHPRTWSRDLTKYVNRELLTKGESAEYVSYRLAITEASRVQAQIQRRQYLDGGFAKYFYIAELDGRTCERCAALDGTIHNTKDMASGVNAEPMHPSCRCSTAAYYEDPAEWERIFGEMLDNMEAEW